jgi:pyruvate kinase
MLSAETSIGKYPAEAAAMMARIAIESENTVRHKGFRELGRRDASTPSYAETMAEVAYRCASLQGAVAIVVFTASGSSARLVARFRPPVPIYAFTHSAAVARQLSIIYGIIPMLVPNPANTDEMVKVIDHTLLGQELVKPHDNVVFIAGQPIGHPGSTNFVKLHRMGELW